MPSPGRAAQQGACQVGISLSLGAHARLGEDPTMTTYALSTIGDLIEDGFALAAHCLRCNRETDLDLKGLARVYGADVPIADLRSQLHCSECGRRAELTISLAATP